MRQQDEDEFVQYVTARRHALRTTAFLLCHDWGAAEDLTQIALVKLYLSWPRLRNKDPESYVRQILVRAFIDETRRPWRRRESLTGMSPEPAGGATSTSECDRPGSDSLFEALRALPRQQRAVIVLRFWDEFSIDEIASALTVSPNTVKTHLTRALTSLRLAVVDFDVHELKGESAR